MNDKIRKILARSATGVVAVSILAYIFWPESQEVVEEIPQTTTTEQTTTTTVKIDESACLILFIKDSDKFLMENTPCLDTYVDRVNSGFYQKLTLTCRSSGDGTRVNRQELSQKRSTSLQFHLMKMGVKFEAIDAQAVADDLPYAGVDPNTEEGKVLNRSCEINGIK
jgi:outer membrane protein OmpA-like peptidoglycan-associated protein